jgi:two-component system sensor histidine kinase/response regulator
MAAVYHLDPQAIKQQLLDDYRFNVKKRSDKLINYFLLMFFVAGLALAGFYDTYTIALGVGGTLIIAYYSVKWLLPSSTLYQYVLSVSLGIFMAQFIYQMHGLFEMHFFAFISGAILITYQNWKLQIPLLVFVAVHHLGLNYLQSIGYGDVYFSTLDHLETETMVIHLLLTIVIYFICGLWSYHLNKYSGTQMAMLSQIQEREAHQQTLERLNAELRQSHQEAVEARKEAENSAQAKSTFLATMSHEIRTPMNGVMGMTALLQETYLTEEQASYVNVISTSGDALLNVINDVLDFSKIDSGHMELEEKSFDLQKCIQDVINLFANKAVIQGVGLGYDIDPVIPQRVIGDTLRLRQVLINLVSNALKFTPEGKVQLSVSYGGQKEHRSVLLFEVRDTGIGIAETKLSKLFKPFSQIDSSDTRKYGGTGLGLIISERLVNLMQGSIQVKSKLGEGSVFYFEIALATSLNQPLAVKAPIRKPTYKPTDTLKSHFAAEHPLKILLAEDNLINLKLATIILRKLGYEADVAHDGREAVEMFARKDYDLILMDIMMPVMNGLEATMHIRSTAAKQPKIIAMTANALPEDRNTCLAAGMDDYLSKPIDMKLLVDMLRSTEMEIATSPVLPFLDVTSHYDRYSS